MTKQERERINGPKALRYNEGKLDWTLLDFPSLVPMVEGMTYGARKYERLNWQKPCDDPKQHLQSAMRHLLAIIGGEEIDPESGVRHSGLIGCNMMMYNFHTMQKEKKDDGEIVYLAIPYSFNPELSASIANKVAGELMSEGCVVFSPISHSHAISETLDPLLQCDQEFWLKQDLEILKHCSKVIAVVIGENGYKLLKESKGCTTEIGYAKANDIPVVFHHYPIATNHPKRQTECDRLGHTVESHGCICTKCGEYTIYS